MRVESWDDDGCWKLARKDKKLVFGRFKVELGGAVDEGLAKNSKWRNREVGPVFFHQKPYTVCFDLASGFFARSVVDFTAHSGPWALVCLRKRIPYVGVTCSDRHSELLPDCLITDVKKALQDPDDPLHKPEFAVKQKDDKKADQGKQDKRGAQDPPDGEKGRAKNQKGDPAKSDGNPAADKAAIVAKLQSMLKKKSAKDKESTAAKGGAETEEDGDDSEEAKDSGEEE